MLSLVKYILNSKLFYFSKRLGVLPANIYLLKVNYRNTREKVWNTSSITNFYKTLSVINSLYYIWFWGEYYNY